MSSNFPVLLEKSAGEIARALPKHLNADRMTRVALTAFRLNPKLAECDPRSVLAAVIISSQLGLEIGGPLAEAHLVPFKNECQLIPDYKGLMKLARNSGQVTDIYACEVRQRDKFSLTLGLHRSMEHEPLMENGFIASDDMRGPVVGFYAVAVMKDGTRTFVPLSRHDVEKVRDGSRGYQTSKRYNKPSPWDTHFVEMGCKTALRRLCKWLPRSPELAAALALENTADRGKKQNLSVDTAINGDFTESYDEEEITIVPQALDAPVETQETDSIELNDSDATLAASLEKCDSMEDLERFVEDINERKGAVREFLKNIYRSRADKLEADKLVG